MDSNTETQNTSRACCSTDKACCKKSRCCCVGKCVALIALLAVVAGVAYCYGSRSAQPTVAQTSATTSSASKTPSLAP